MAPHLEPDGGELTVRSDGTGVATSVDGVHASVTTPEPGVQLPAPTAPLDGPGLPSDRPRGRRIVLIGVLVLVLGVAGVGGYALLGDRSAGSDATTKAVTTAVVSRATLVDTEQEDGALGY